MSSYKKRKKEVNYIFFEGTDNSINILGNNGYKVKIIGRKDKLIKDYVIFLLKELFEEHYEKIRKLSINVIFANSQRIKELFYSDENQEEEIFDKMKNIKIYGFCLPEDNVKPYKNFMICVRKGGEREIVLKTLAHEFIHALQYRLGKLYQDYRNGNVVWNGVRYKREIDDYTENMKGDNEEEILQSLPPWENEAFLMEEKLYEKWIKNSS